MPDYERESESLSDFKIELACVIIQFAVSVFLLVITNIGSTCVIVNIFECAMCDCKCL